MNDEFIETRDLGDGRTLFVFPLLGGRARLGIGPSREQYFYDEW